MERVSAFHSAKQAQMRASLRTRRLERAHDALDRFDAEHIDFKVKDATEVEYRRLRNTEPSSWRGWGMGKSVSKKAARAAFAASIARQQPTTFSPKRRLAVLRVDAKLEAEVKRAERKAAKQAEAKLTG